MKDASRLTPYFATRQTTPTSDEHATEQNDEARLADDFTRLLQQYRRAGYECFQRGQQSDDESAAPP